ncbi:MAG TPA: hypothetical protein VEF06_10700, partial [Bryobacteraceae bacterium]|nr:hypothetical protein [Bryobacteraceae bacterium]
MSNILGTLRRFSLFFLCFWASLAALLIAAHLAHSGYLWEGDVLPAAAALEMKRGSLLYRDVWYDKPPLVPAICLLWGARIGAALRLGGAVYGFAACVLAYAFAARAWTRREGYWAAAL